MQRLKRIDNKAHVSMFVIITHTYLPKQRIIKEINFQKRFGCKYLIFEYKKM